MIGEPIRIPALDFHLGEKERARLDAANSKFTVLHEGRLLPVLIMYGMESQIVVNPLHAFVCIARDTDGQIVQVQCVPGDIARRSACDGEVPRRSNRQRRRSTGRSSRFIHRHHRRGRAQVACR